MQNDGCTVLVFLEGRGSVVVIKKIQGGGCDSLHPDFDMYPVIYRLKTTMHEFFEQGKAK